MALSSLVHALHELSSVAIARFVAKPDKSPELVLLSPIIEPDAEYLVDVSLPFAEDVRAYRFPPLDRVLLASGKSLTIHRHLPDDKLQSAMDKFIDAMDLDTYHDADGWDPSSFADNNDNAHDAFSPIPHRIDQAIRYRATNPQSNIPPPYSILTKYSAPPSDLVPEGRLSDLIEAAAVKKVPAQVGATHRRRNREAAATTLSGLDVQSLLRKRNTEPQVDPDNPIPSFRQMLDTTKNPNGIQQAAEQFGAIIENRVRKAVGGREDERIIEEMGVFREEMVEMEEPAIWNKWALAFRRKVLAGELGGERRELWWKVRSQGMSVSLIGGAGDDVDEKRIAEYGSLKL